MPNARRSPTKSRRTFTTRGPFGTRRALHGIRAVEAELRASLVQKAKDEARGALLRRQIVAAQARLLKGAAGERPALRRLATAHRQQMRRLVRQAAKRLAGARRGPAPQPMESPTISLLVPPYAYEWSSTYYIDYAPGQLSATADRDTGSLTYSDSFDCLSDQVDRSGGASALGVYFKPFADGVLQVDIPASLSYQWDYLCDCAGCNTRGWAGLLVQCFPSGPKPGGGGHVPSMFTPVLQQHVFFDNGCKGSIFDVRADVGKVNTTYDFQATFAVDHRRWYAIWLWCGGDIHAEGLTEDSYVYGSCADGAMQVSAPYIILNFTVPGA